MNSFKNNNKHIQTVSGYNIQYNFIVPDWGIQ